MASCGGGGGGASDPGVSPPPASSAPEKPASRAEAARFLTQATFGPTDAEVDHLMSVGYSAWIDEQFAKPASSNLALSDAKATANNATPNTAQDGTTHAFWRNAITGDDQLRQRFAYSLSQIFVISMQDANVDARAAAGFLDMLGDKGLGNYRDLIQAVSKHPAMLAYLTALRNQKADPQTGRVPDDLAAVAARSIDAETTLRTALKEPSDPLFGTAPASGSYNASADPKLLYDNPLTGARSHADLMARLAHAMRYFDTTLGAMGARSKVTTFTASEFGRTFTSSGDGTDHGWGGHHFVMGGAVKGGDIYGKVPVLGEKNANNNEFDSSPNQIGNGSLLPTPPSISSARRWRAGSACRTPTR